MSNPLIIFAPFVSADISNFVLEGARDGESVANLMEKGGEIIKKINVMEGISDMVSEVTVAYCNQTGGK